MLLNLPMSATHGIVQIKHKPWKVTARVVGMLWWKRTVYDLDNGDIQIFDSPYPYGY